MSFISQGKIPSECLLLNLYLVKILKSSARRGAFSVLHYLPLFEPNLNDGVKKTKNGGLLKRGKRGSRDKEREDGGVTFRVAECSVRFSKDFFFNSTGDLPLACCDTKTRLG